MRNLSLKICLTMIMAFVVVDAQAALNLNVSPVSGGNDLRFGRVPSTKQASKEVRVRITSTDGVQYQLYHRLVGPFYNEKNVSMGRNAVSTYTLQGSNAFGTLYAQSPEPMGLSDQLIYSSSTSGTSDALTIVYVVDGARIESSGSFFGRIQFTARPVSGGSQVDIILNVTVETSGEFSIDVKGSSTVDSLRLSHSNDRQKEGYVDFTFEENLGRQIQIFQEVEPFPQDELFNEINDDAIMFIASGATRGALQPRTLTQLTRKRTLIYSSRENTETFRMNYALDLNGIERQKAGTYKGELKYFVQTEENEQYFTIDLEVKVDPIFAIDVNLPAGGLSFEQLLPNSQPIVREVEVDVKSNLGRPYMVMQNVVSPLTNEKGSAMPDEHFTYRGKLLDQQSGKILNKDYTAVPSGESPLFVSDNKGSPSRFEVNYRVRPYPTMIPGDYTTSIRYSLGEK